MKFFVYWPAAIHPDLKRALLIGYGAGSTAKALTDTGRLERIDVVDISRDVLELSDVVYPDPQDDPLNDSRVHAHVEDGRYFLLTTTRRYDLITAEPPPPVVSGAVNLYTQEYFELIHDRLAEGGIVTYWLPVSQMSVPTARSSLAAFCNAFEDCSLWSGCKFDWVMVGTRGAVGPGSERRFTEQWRDPVVSPEMKALGFETPHQLGATFIGDARHLAAMIDGAPPLDDDHPKRLLPRRAASHDRRQYWEWTDTPVTQKRFAESPLIRRLWPESLARSALAYFQYQRVANMQIFANHENVLRIIDRLLHEGNLRTAPLWLMGSSVHRERIVARRVAEGRERDLSRYLGATALADRRYEQAAHYFGLDTRSDPMLTEPLRVYSLCKAGQGDAAKAVAQRFVATYRRPLNYACWQ
jgi:hypothetical protein